MKLIFFISLFMFITTISAETPFSDPKFAKELSQLSKDYSGFKENDLKNPSFSQDLKSKLDKLWNQFPEIKAYMAQSEKNSQKELTREEEKACKEFKAKNSATFDKINQKLKNSKKLTKNQKQNIEQMPNIFSNLTCHEALEVMRFQNEHNNNKKFRGSKKSQRINE